jgi:hypothetical protein
LRFCDSAIPPFWPLVPRGHHSGPYCPPQLMIAAFRRVLLTFFFVQPHTPHLIIGMIAQSVGSSDTDSFSLHPDIPPKRRECAEICSEGPARTIRTPGIPNITILQQLHHRALESNVFRCSDLALRGSRSVFYDEHYQLVKDIPASQIMPMPK